MDPLQSELFAPALPPGFVYHAAFLSAAEEAQLLAWAATQPFGEVVFQGHMAKRTVVHYGYDYAYTGRSVAPGVPMPEIMTSLVARIAVLAGVAPGHFVEALLTRYPPGAGIGWHRDAPAFGEPVAGLSFGGAAVMRLRPLGATRGGVSVPLQPRSLYLIGGAARWQWRHHLPPVAALRYSLTVRPLRAAA